MNTLELGTIFRLAGSAAGDVVLAGAAAVAGAGDAAVVAAGAGLAAAAAAGVCGAAAGSCFCVCAQIEPAQAITPIWMRILFTTLPPREVLNTCRLYPIKRVRQVTSGVRAGQNRIQNKTAGRVSCQPFMVEIYKQKISLPVATSDVRHGRGRRLGNRHYVVRRAIRRPPGSYARHHY